MKKKLFILLFLLCTSSAFAQEDLQTAVPDEFESALIETETVDIQLPKWKKYFNFSFLRRTKNANVKKNKNAETVSDYAEKAQGGSDEALTEVSSDSTYNAEINTTKIIEIDECVKIAMKNHPAIHAALANADIYKSRIAMAWANYFPTLSAGLSYSRNDTQTANFAMPVQRYNMYYVPNISANMLLFDFGKTKSQADIAKKAYESAKYGLETSINTVVYNVKQSYYNLLFALQQVKVYEDTVHDFELHLEQAQAYYRIGTKPKIDVLTAEYNLGKAKLNLIQANNTLKVAYIELSNAMGMPDYTDYEVIDNLSSRAYDITIDNAVNTAYETSPELLAAQKKSDASSLLVRASKRAFTPNLSGFASYTRGGKKPDTDEGYQIGAQLSYQTVNLFALKKEVEEAKATYEKDFAEYKNIKQNIQLEVKQAYLNMITAQESITVAKLSMEQAKEQYDLAAGRYKVGLGDAIELKDAETTFRNSQLDYYNSLLKYHVSAANLERLMGVPMKQSDTEML